MKAVDLTVNPRTLLGRKVKALRRDGLVPGNIVARGKDSRAVEVEYNPLVKVLDLVGYTQPVMLSLSGDDVIVLVTEVTHNPTKNTIDHITFQEVKKGELVTADVPLVLVGEAPATQLGNIIIQIMDTVEVEAGALSIPEHFDVDISGLTEDGDGVRVSELTVPEGVEIKADQDSTIVRAETPRAEIEEEEEELEEGEEGAEGAEGEEGTEGGEGSDKDSIDKKD